jgi:hypothetical protein
MSADTDFHVSYRRVELRAPFLLACATDGCFGYLPTPVHFEHLLLNSLKHGRSVSAWSEALQAGIATVTGDDAAMAMMGVGADLAEFKALFGPRVAQLEREFITPLDQMAEAVARAEQDLHVLRGRQVDQTAEVWARYKSDYEHYLRPPPPAPGPEEVDGEVVRDSEHLDNDTAASGEDSSSVDRETGSVPDDTDVPVTSDHSSAETDGVTETGANPATEDEEGQS